MGQCLAPLLLKIFFRVGETLENLPVSSDRAEVVEFENGFGSNGSNC